MLDSSAVRQFADDVDRLGKRCERRRPAVQHPNRGISSADPANRPVAEHLVQGREQRRRDGPVPGRRVRHHRADDDLAGRGEDLAIDDERLLPQQVRVERPHMSEAERLRFPGQVDHPRSGRVGLQHDPDIQTGSPAFRDRDVQIQACG